MDFSKAFYALMADEGLWHLEHDPRDPGGETWSGISRKNHPRWEGWSLIDQAKADGVSVTRHRNFERIKALTEKFYEDTFWRPLDCDKLPDGLAYELFEQAVNLGSPERRTTSSSRSTASTNRCKTVPKSLAAISWSIRPTARPPGIDFWQSWKRGGPRLCRTASTACKLPGTSTSAPRTSAGVCTRTAGCPSEEEARYERRFESHDRRRGAYGPPPGCRLQCLG